MGWQQAYSDRRHALSKAALVAWKHAGRRANLHGILEGVGEVEGAVAGSVVDMPGLAQIAKCLCDFRLQCVHVRSCQQTVPRPSGQPAAAMDAPAGMYVSL